MLQRLCRIWVKTAEQVNALPMTSSKLHCVIEQSTWRNLPRLAAQKSYNWGYKEEDTWRLVGGVETWNRPAPHPYVAEEYWEWYLRCRDRPWRARGHSFTQSSLVQRLNARKRNPHNIWLWKSVRIPSIQVRGEAAGNPSNLLKDQYADSLMGN